MDHQANGQTCAVVSVQTDLCGLDDVKYNFVGKFETLAEDVKSVTARFGHKNLSVFKFNVHPTNTDSKLQNLYTKVSTAALFCILLSACSLCFQIARFLQGHQ